MKKQMGTQLGILITNCKRKTLDNGKRVKCYGTTNKYRNSQLADISIRRSVNTLENMRKDVLAICFHEISSDGNQQHGLCPKGSHFVSHWIS